MPRGASRHPERWASQAQSKRSNGWHKKLKSQGDHLCRADQRSRKNTKTPQMGFSQSALATRESKQTHSSSVPHCHPLPLLWQVLFPKINPKAKLPKTNYKAQLSSQVAFDNAKHLGPIKSLLLQIKWTSSYTHITLLWHTCQTRERAGRKMGNETTGIGSNFILSIFTVTWNLEWLRQRCFSWTSTLWRENEHDLWKFWFMKFHF